MKEIELESYLVKKLDEKNIFHFKGNPSENKGFPDRVVMGERIYFVELKLGKENGSYYKQTKMQKKWDLQISQTKDIYFLLYSHEDIDRFVDYAFEKCKSNKIKNYFAFNTDIK